VYRWTDARPGLLTDLGFSVYTHHNPWLMALYTLSLMIGTAGLPHVIIRFFTVPKVATHVGPPAGRWCSSHCCTSRHRPWVQWRA
jgi:hypothetical protein